MDKYNVVFYLDANSISAEVVVEAESQEQAIELGRDKVRETYDGSTFMGSEFDITLGYVEPADANAEDNGSSLLQQLMAVAQKNRDMLDEYNQAGEVDDWTSRDFDDIERDAINETKQEMLSAVINMFNNGGINPEVFAIEELKYGA